MTLDYTNSNTGVFTHLGKLVKYWNVADSNGGTSVLDAELQAIMTAFQNGGQSVAIDGMPTAYQGFRSSFVSRKGTLASYALRRLQDPTSVLSILDCLTSSQEEIFDKLITAMIADSKTVKSNTPTINSITANGSNVGTGTILTTGILDGYSSPGANPAGRFRAHLRYKGVTSELLPIADSFLWAVRTDSFTDGVSEGSENIGWNGNAPGAAYGISSLSTGSGQIATIQPIQSAGILQNLDFESFTTNTPASFTIDLGTAGTHVFGDSTSTNFYHGAKGLKLTGDGALAAIQLSQPVPLASVQANRGYCVTARIKASASVSAGDLLISFTGTGYSAASTEKIAIAHGSLPTSWTLYNFFINLPATLPSDFALTIKWSGTPTSAKSVWIDDMGFGPVSYGAGMGCMAVRGATPFVRGDSFTTTVTCTGGVFQSFFRDAFGYQLPSSGSNNINEALAT